MTPVSNRNFGLLIAYLIPGFLTLNGLSVHSETIRSWLGGTGGQAPTLGGFLYVTVTAVGAGLTVSTIRWLILDHLHHATGLRTGAGVPRWPAEEIAAIEAAVEYHYRYYQFYGNTLVALLIVAVCRSASPRVFAAIVPLRVLTLSGVAVLFFFASRDALKKYYARTQTASGQTQVSKGEASDDQRCPPQTDHQRGTKDERLGGRKSKVIS